MIYKSLGGILSHTAMRHTVTNEREKHKLGTMKTRNEDTATVV